MVLDQDRDRPIECLEVCWRLRSRSGSVFECGIYRNDMSTDVRITLGEDTVYSELVLMIGQGREIAERWRQTILAKGGVEELFGDDRKR